MNGKWFPAFSERMFDLEKLFLEEIAGFCETKTNLKGFVTKISIDSRDIDENTLFVAIVGERFDGNDFVPDVLKKGVKAVVASKYDGTDERVIKVPDTGRALLKIAKGYREKFNIPVIALTGSVGKTTTKGMVFSVVNEKYNTMRTEGNLNNEIGVPKTLFRLTSETQAAVIEMGMNHSGEIHRISEAVMPDIGIITNIGTAHIENLGSREGILKAKCEMLDGMKKGSVIFVNGDNDMLSSLTLPDYKLKKFGIESKKYDIYAENIVAGTEGTHFTAVTKNEKAEIFVPAAGIHNVYNALCALGVGKELGISLEEGADGIKKFIPEGMRQKITKVKDYVFIEDCYNANPDSMKASLSTLNTIKTKRSIAVLGDMLELGTYSEKAHRETGEFAALKNTDILFTYGELSKFTADEGEKCGIKCVKAFDDKNELTNCLKTVLESGDTVLFKGSRGMEMEDIFNTLYREWNI